MYIIVVYILSILYAYFSGKHDVPAVNSFAQYGSSPAEQNLFHGANWKMKAVYCSTTFLPCFFLPFSFEMILICSLGLGVAWMNIWAWFDIVIVKYRFIHRPWYYLSNGNATDRKLLQMFGEKAGVYKLIGCVFLSFVFVFLYFKFFS